MYRPDCCAGVQILAPGKEEIIPTEIIQLGKIITRLIEIRDIGLKYKPLNMESIRMELINDASFGNDRNFKSQLGYLVLLEQDTGTEHIIHYARNRCKIVKRSVLAAEVHALMLEFDFAYLLRDLTSGTWQRRYWNAPYKKMLNWIVKPYLL